MNYLKTLIVTLLILAPLTGQAASKPWYQMQLELETFNLEHYGNPFGSTGKAGELYDPVTGLPWWRIQLDKEALYMELYGNPCGKDGCNPTKTEPIKAPIIVVYAPIMSNPIESTPEAAQAQIEPLTIDAKLWDVELTGNWEGTKTFMRYEALWNGSEQGSIRCVTHDYPDGVYLDQALPSGKQSELDVDSWQTGDTATCTWKVGEVTKEMTYTK